MMNKKELAEFTETKERISKAMALHWPIDPKPSSVNISEAMNGKTFGELFVGWTMWSHEGKWRVSKGCSSGHSHSTNQTDKTSSQGGGIFYASESDACLAARWVLCEGFAKTLAELDARYIDAKTRD